MLGVIVSALGRRRRGILIAGSIFVAFAGVTAELVPVDHPLGDAVFYLVLGCFLLVGALVVLCLVAQPRPAVLEVTLHPPAFRAPPNAAQAFVALVFLLVAIRHASDLVAGRANPVFDTVLLLGELFVAAVSARTAWRGDGLELRPDGLVEIAPLGSLFIPWAALPPGYPVRPQLQATRLDISAARPDLVRRRGFVPQRQVLVDTVHPGFIADAIRYYVDHPAHRTAIGTPSEYERLRRHLTSRPASSS